MTTIAQPSVDVSVATQRPGNMSRFLAAWRRRLLIGIVIAYTALLILAPLAALVSGALSKGIGASFATLSDPAVFAAFTRTLYLSLIVVGIHVVFGSALA